jgi:hypothetical protein
MCTSFSRHFLINSQNYFPGANDSPSVVPPFVDVALVDVVSFGALVDVAVPFAYAKLVLIGEHPYKSTLGAHYSDFQFSLPYFKK